MRHILLLLKSVNQFFNIIYEYFPMRHILLLLKSVNQFFNIIQAFTGQFQ